MDLYDVTTTVKEYHGCKNVKFHWLRLETAPRPYADLIENYDPSKLDVCYSEHCIDELFELDEAQALKDYLDREVAGRQDITTIEKAKLPIPNNSISPDAIGVGGGDDFYQLDKTPNYSLPFKVWGYYDLVGCELADGSGETFRHYYLLVKPDANGEVECRTETQEEARFRESERTA
jgi:hypothetical protein